jgi:Prokaryotic E2 family E
MGTMAANATSVGEAIEAIEREFPGAIWSSDAEGGALVTVPDFELGGRWSPSAVTLEFQLLFNYPFAAVYPYFTTPELVRADGAERPPALQIVQWRGRQMTQVSLRSHNWNPQHDSAVSSLKLVRHWFETVTP